MLQYLIFVVLINPLRGRLILWIKRSPIPLYAGLAQVYCLSALGCVLYCVPSFSLASVVSLFGSTRMTRMFLWAKSIHTYLIKPYKYVFCVFALNAHKIPIYNLNYIKFLRSLHSLAPRVAKCLSRLPGERILFSRRTLRQPASNNLT